MKTATPLFVFLLLTAATGSANADGKRAPGSLPTQNFDFGVAAVDVTLSFDDVQNLSLASAGLTALLLASPIDPLLLARLPALVTIPAALPIKVDVSPPPVPLTGLEFNGIATVELYTTDLNYTPGTRLRLFTAHDGGPFVDITREASAGSYRVRGSQGEFSEFLIVEDNRDSADVVNTKFARLSALLTASESAIDAALYATLSTELASAQSAWAADDVDAAKTAVTAFNNALAGASGAQIPRTWRSIQDVDNIAGRLQSIADTLLYSLEDARDTDLDSVYDWADNCTLVSNPSQCDSDNDGFGNRCDADLDNNGIVNTLDLAGLREVFGSFGSSAADFDCNDVVNTLDLAIMRERFGQPPGPAAP